MVAGGFNHGCKGFQPWLQGVSTMVAGGFNPFGSPLEALGGGVVV